MLQLYLLVRMEESIYNIIPKQYPNPQKQPLYKSKYPHNIPPTGSTFCHKTTSKPGVGNLGGQYSLGLQAHTQYGGSKTFGHVKGARKSSPETYLQKSSGTMGNETLPPVRNYSYDCKAKKQPVPKVNEKPPQATKTNKNFIVQNAIQNILSTAKKMPEKVDWLKKKDFGKTPQYIGKIKDSIQKEYTMIQNLHSQTQPKQKCLSEEEINQIRDGLKRKWEEVNREYQKLTHIKIIDTVGLKNRKEGYEKQLAEIQRDMRKLNKQYIFVGQ